MQLAVKDVEGKTVRQIAVDDAVFGIQPNLAVLHQAFVAQRANQRRGSASTKTRGQVQGSTRKIRTQKYTGRARQGSIRAPHRRGGGVVFGPRPRDYSQRLPKRMKRLAIRSALSGKVADGQLVVVEELKLEPPKTKEMKRILTNLGLERSALIVTGEADPKAKQGAHNLPKTKVLSAAYLNVVDMLTHRDVVMTVSAVAVAEALWGGDRAKLRRAPLPAVAAPVEPPSLKARRPRVAKAAAEPVAQPTPRPRRVGAKPPAVPAGQTQTRVAAARMGAARPKTRRPAAAKATATKKAEKPKAPRSRTKKGPDGPLSGGEGQ